MKRGKYKMSLNLITKQTFEGQTTEGKLSILFDQQQIIIDSLKLEKEKRDKEDNDSSKILDDRYKECDHRFKALERFHMWLTGGIAALSFVIGVLLSRGISL